MEALKELGRLLVPIGGGLFAAGLVLPLVPVNPWAARRTHEQRRPRPSSVDVIVPAYLEASVVVAKIRSSKAALQRSGVAGRVIVVASDPETAAAAAASGEADLVISTQRDGKPQAINRGVAASTADVCVSSDANCLIEPEAWPTRLLDAMVTMDLLSAEKREHGGHEGAFWFLERLYKRPGRTAETLAVAGEFMAFRRSDFQPIPPTTLCDDLWQALDFHERGLKVGIAGGVFTSEPAAAPRDQWGRRTRIAQGLLLEATPRVGRLIRTPLGRHFLTHKIYRMTVGCLGFWLGVVGVVALLPWWIGVVVVALVIGLGMIYAGRIGPLGVLAPAASVVGLLSVPPVAALQAVRRSLRVSRPQGAGWVKIAR